LPNRSGGEQVVATRTFPKETIMPPVKKVAAAPASKKAAPTKAAASTNGKSTAPAKAVATKRAATDVQKANAAAAQTAPQVTITLKQIAAELAEGHSLPKKQTEAMLGDLVTLTTGHLKQGDKIRLTGLGILQVRARPARTGRNPATGESINIAASKKIAFRPAKELKEAV
jgi:DNA-binding protein HU-beta